MARPVITKPNASRRDPLLASSVAFLLLVAISALFAPSLSPYTASGLEEKRILEPPSWNHLMGTDGLGRDLLTRVLYGARVSMTVGLGTALISLVIGTSYGLVSGFRGGGI